MLANFSDQEACCPLAKNPEVTRQILISNYDDVNRKRFAPMRLWPFMKEKERMKIFKPLGYHFFSRFCVLRADRTPIQLFC